MYHSIVLSSKCRFAVEAESIKGSGRRLGEAFRKRRVSEDKFRPPPMGFEVLQNQIDWGEPASTAMRVVT